MSPDAELDLLYRSLFGKPAPEALARRFAPVSQQIDQQVDPHELAAYRRALETCTDLEALEYAARLSGRLPLLSRKLRACVALAETLPENQAAYIARRASRAAALRELAAAGVASAFKAAKGFWLLRSASHD